MRGLGDYIIQMPDGRFVQKGGGMNDFVRKPRDATRFETKDEAHDARPGHHRDMGGSGFKGRVITYSSVEWMNDRED